MMDTSGVLTWLEKRGTRRNVEGMARYGIRATRAFGVSMGTMKPLVKRLGKDHALAAALWKSGWFEARMLAALIDDPTRVTRRQMNAWVGGFENWADCESPLREESRELGPAIRRSAQYGAQRGCDRGGEAAGPIGRGRLPLGRHRRPARVRQSRCAGTAGAPRRAGNRSARVTAARRSSGEFSPGPSRKVARSPHPLNPPGIRRWQASCVQ